MKSTKFFTRKEVFKFVISLFAVMVAGAIGGASFKTFLASNGIISTGFSGLSQIINRLLQNVVAIPTSVIYLFFNVIIYIFAFKEFGWKFIVLSLAGTATYILAMQFGYIEALANAEAEPVVFAVVGGMLSGATVGFALRMGGTTGGTDVAGAVINKKFPNIKPGFGMLIVNVTVLVLSTVTVGIQTGLYALVIAVINSITTNMIVSNSKRVVAFYIICDKDEEIAETILEKYHRGVTKIDAQGMFSKKDKKLLLCLLPYENSSDVKKIISQIDENAFVFSEHVDETMGDGKFLKEASIFKNKIKTATANIKTKQKFLRHKNIKKLNYPKKRTRFYLK